MHYINPRLTLTCPATDSLFVKLAINVNTQPHQRNGIIEYSGDHTVGTLNTAAVPDEVRDTESRDAGVTACGVLLAAYNKYHIPVKDDIVVEN